MLNFSGIKTNEISFPFRAIEHNYSQTSIQVREPGKQQSTMDKHMGLSMRYLCRINTQPIFRGEGIARGRDEGNKRWQCTEFIVQLKHELKVILLPCWGSNWDKTPPKKSYEMLGMLFLVYVFSFTLQWNREGFIKTGGNFRSPKKVHPLKCNAILADLTFTSFCFNQPDCRYFWVLAKWFHPVNSEISRVMMAIKEQ